MLLLHARLTLGWGCGSWARGFGGDFARSCRWGKRNQRGEFKCVKDITPYGSIGDPSLASAEIGEKLYEKGVNWICEQIKRELGPFVSGEQDTT